jgi:hypothetical protein
VADEARGAIRRDVVDLAGQWAQFGGWLRASTGQPAKARDWYARTLEYATEAGSRDLVATALSMRGRTRCAARWLSAPLAGHRREATLPRRADHAGMACWIALDGQCAFTRSEHKRLTPPLISGSRV